MTERSSTKQSIPPRLLAWLLLAGGMALSLASLRTRRTSQPLPPELYSKAALVAAETPVARPSLPQPAEAPAPSVLGAWDDDFYGRRRMTFHADGTATMDLELDPVSRLLYGPKLRFDITWQQTGDLLVLRMHGGDPPEATKALAKLFGETSEQTIESLTGDELQLRSKDSGKLYIHRRVVKPDSMVE